MYHRMLRLPVVKQCFTQPVLRSSFVAAHLATLPRPDRRARRLFLTLYYSIGVVCLATVTFLNCSLLSGYGAEHKYYALLLLAISMAVLIVSSTRYEKRHHAAYLWMLRESPFRELE
jgi:hypothetical protein